MESILAYINVQQLVNFVTVVEKHGFLAASEHLNMTQSSVSKSIARLEETLGFPLFVKEAKGSRVFRGIELTEKGKFLYQYWGPALKNIEDAYNSVVEADKKEKQRIRIGYTNSTDPDLYLWPCINEFVDQNRGVKLDIEGRYRTDLIPALLDGKYDMVFVPDIEYDSINHVLMDFRYVGIDNAQIMVPDGHPLYEKDFITVEDVKDVPFFMFSDGGNKAVKKTFLKFFESIGIHPPMIESERDAFNIVTAYYGDEAFYLIDSFYAMKSQHGFRKIPLKGYYNGILCVWRKNAHREQNIRNLLKSFPDQDEKKKDKKPVIQMS